MNAAIKLDMALSFLKARFLKKKTPLLVGWALTKRCNKSCIFCHNEKDIGRELNTQESVEMIDRLAIAGTKIVQFTGGEPLLRDDICLLIRHAKSKKLMVSLSSNGTFFPEKIEQIQGLDVLNLSFEGSPKTHDLLRGQGSYHEVIHALGLAVRRGFNVRLCMTLSKLNLDETDFVLEIARKFSVKVLFQPAVRNSEFSSQDSFIATDDLFRKKINELIEKKQKGERCIGNSLASLRYMLNWPNGKKILCGAGILFCRIEPDGKIYPCSRTIEKKYAVTPTNDFMGSFSKLKNVGCDACWANSLLEANLLLSLDPDVMIGALKGTGLSAYKKKYGRIIPRRVIKFYPGEFKDILKVGLGLMKAAGSQVELFENEFKAFVGAKHAVAVGSGREALRLILTALDLRSGDEVILPAYTLADLPQMLKTLGLKPVFVDVDLDQMNMSLLDIEKKITPRTKVLVATHLFGVPCDIERIKQSMDEKGIFIVEDCAHALGAKVGNRFVGTFGGAAFFSFSVGKHINAFGGGMIVSEDDSLITAVRHSLVKKKGGGLKVMLSAMLAFSEKVFMESPFAKYMLMSRKNLRLLIRSYGKIKDGIGARGGAFSEAQACVGRKQLELLRDALRSREEKVRLFKECLGDKFDFQKVRVGDASANYFFIIRSRDRGLFERLVERFARAGIDVGLGGEIMDHCPRALGEDASHYPNACILERDNIQLPLYENLSDEAIRYIGEIAHEASF